MSILQDRPADLVEPPRRHQWLNMRVEVEAGTAKQGKPVRAGSLLCLPPSPASQAALTN